jgi:2-oxoglutarate ferredoxin oxidoreductase subunit alpha
MSRVLMEGNKAIAEAAVLAGCRAYFGYPITPQNELGEHMARRLPEAGGVFVQAESEVAAINMVYGAAGAGARVMTSTSSPGFSLMTEGISYMIGARVPCVIVDVMRGGPGLGNIAPSQADYFQVTRGLGHGDTHGVVLGPSTIQEAVDVMGLAFATAERYRLPVVVAADGILGQMMEPVVLPDPVEPPPPPAWATTGTGGERRLINSIYLQPEHLEQHVQRLMATYEEIRAKEQRWESYRADDADLILIAFGTTARIARSAVDRVRANGIRAGLIRPITLWPFPVRAFDRTPRRWLVVEMNSGMMVEDVRLATGDRAPVDVYGRLGGMVPTPAEVAKVIEAVAVREVVAA